MELQPLYLRVFFYLCTRNLLYSMDIACPAYPNRREFGRLSQVHICICRKIQNVDK